MRLHNPHGISSLIFCFCLFFAELAQSTSKENRFISIREQLSEATALICSSGELKPLAPKELAHHLEYRTVEHPIIKPTTGLLRWRTVLSDPQRGKLVFIGRNIGLRSERLEIQASIWKQKKPRPIMMVRLDNTCRVVLARAIEYQAAGLPEMLVHLDNSLSITDSREPLNPAVPEGRKLEGVPIAHIDSGVNYLLAGFRDRLARDHNGHIHGWDFWDNDHRPFDINIVSSPFFPLHHGTTVASILLREAPKSVLIPYRYPRPDMSMMANVIKAAASARVRIALLPMGSAHKNEWAAFASAAKKHGEILFIVSAGNNGRNIDEAPLFPASLTLENILVVTSADDFGRLAPGSNWGAESVDLMVPGENIEVIDHRGAKGRASGASFAAPRIAALAARYLATKPLQKTAELKAAILSLAVQPRMRGDVRVKAGWIPNPTDHY